MNKKRVKESDYSENFRRSRIEQALHGLANDAFRALDSRGRPEDEAQPPPPSQDFGYEIVGVGLKAKSREKELAALLGEAASFQRWRFDGKPQSEGGQKSATDDARSFKRLLSRNIDERVTSKTLYLFGAACWTLGARYSSGPLALSIAGLHLQSVRIIGGSKAYALKYGVIDELVHYAVQMKDIARLCTLDNWIARLRLFQRPLTYAAVLEAVKQDEPLENGESVESYEAFFEETFNEWNEREAKRSAIRLSPLAMICIKQSYLNFFHGDMPWQRPLEHTLFLAATAHAELDNVYNTQTPLSYALLADYLAASENIDVEKQNSEIGIDPDNLDQGGLGEPE